MAEEAKIREYCKRGRECDAFDGSGKQTSSPEREYEWYRKHDRPVHELLRSWCGHRTVTFVERLTAAEAEVRLARHSYCRGDRHTQAAQHNPR